jgi:thymidylate kinase
MIVELAGIPGAGKTTLLPLVKCFLQDRGLKPMSREEARRCCLERTVLGKTLYRLPSAVVAHLAAKAADGLVIALFVLKFCWANAVLVRHVMVFQIKRPISVMHFAMVLRSFFRTVGCYQFFRDYLQPGEAVVVDEGFVHRVVSLYVSEADVAHASVLRSYLNLLPQIDLIIVVNASPHECVDRILRRRVPKRLRRLPSSHIARVVTNMAEAIKIVSNYLSISGSLMIEVENNHTLGTSIIGLNDRLSAAVPNRLSVRSVCPPTLNVSYAVYAE